MARVPVYVNIAAIVGLFVLVVSVVELVQADIDDQSLVSYPSSIFSFQGRDAVRCSNRLRSRCRNVILVCPRQCPRLRTVAPGKSACFIDCSSKCQSTCKHRKPNCSGFGSICYDPRFVGGDGIMFYFHGQSNKDFCIVSDTNLHINAHFIGKRTEGRKRDYTWVQALGIIYGHHRLIIAAKKVASWSENVDQLILSYDGVDLSLPVETFSRWISKSGETTVERLENTNSAVVSIVNLMTVSVKVIPVTEKDSKVHNYQIDADNCYAHLDLQFQFLNLSSKVDGVLGQTYRPDFKSPVKVGVPMPIMGGDGKFSSSTLLTTDCRMSIFSANGQLQVHTSIVTHENLTSTCRGAGGSQGIVCRR